MIHQLFTLEQEERINQMIFDFLTRYVSMRNASQVPDGYVVVPVSKNSSEELPPQSRGQLQQTDSH